MNTTSKTKNRKLIHRLALSLVMLLACTGMAWAETIDLNQQNFQKWNADGTPYTGSEQLYSGQVTYNVGSSANTLKAGELVYGVAFGEFSELYTELSDYKKIHVEGTNGVKVRFMFNKDKTLTEKTITIANGVADFDITAYSTFHLNSVKLASDSPSGKITALQAISDGVSKGVMVKKSMTVDGKVREYGIYVPKSYTGSSKVPVVFSLHGTSNDYDSGRVDFNSLAETNRFIVIYPRGLIRNFPVFGGDARGWQSTGEECEDIEFFKQIVTDELKDLAIDSKRIYMCGFSNGGMMTYQVAHQESEMFAAFASVAGYPLNEFHLRHAGARPVPFLHIHGKDDNFVDIANMPTIVDNMVYRNGCNPVPKVTTVTGKYKKNVYSAKAGEGFDYQYYVVDGLGHYFWSGNLDIAQTMWDFLSKYTLDNACDKTLKFKPGIETSGFSPTAHGWTKNSGSILWKYGESTSSSVHNNTSHSLQFAKGNYYMKLKAENSSSSSATVSVKIGKIGSSTVVFNKKYDVNQEIIINFTTSDNWAEYVLTIDGNGNSNTVISGIEIHSGTADATPEYGSVKCEAPTIELIDGELIMKCSTPGAKYYYSVTTNSTCENVETDGKLDFKPTFIVSAYAVAPGCSQSVVVKKEFPLATAKKGDVNGDGSVNVADAVEVIDIYTNKK